jgi:hypothetical protein
MSQARGKPPIRNTDSAPFIFFDGVATYGVVNGVIHLELVSRVLLPSAEAPVTTEFVSTGRLRCGPTALAHLRDSIDKVLEMLKQPEQTPAVAATTLN